MTTQIGILGISALITAVIQFGGFVVAYLLQTETFFDILGGINFVALGIYSAIDGESVGTSWSSDSRKVASSIAFFSSRSWLLIFLAWRAYERGGDSRFDELKSDALTFFYTWLFQFFWVFIIALPIIFVNSSPKLETDFSVLDYLTIIGFGFAVIVEIFADIQKARWVKAGRKGNFCQVGIWKYSRHPNYFGEIFQWWCAWGFSFGSGTGFNDVQWWVGILSPLLTMLILLYTPTTGVMNANGQSLKRYYDKSPIEYAKYRESTSILIPMVGYKYVPLILKRTIFLDFKMYEYEPEDNTYQIGEQTKEEA